MDNAAPEADAAPEQKIADEVCERDFQRMCKARRIDTNTAKMPKGTKARFEARKAALLAPMRRGELVVDPEGTPIYTPPVPGAKALKFHRATGATLMAGDGYNETQDVGRLVAIATEMTKSIPGALSELEVEDFRVVSDVVNFFITR